MRIAFTNWSNRLVAGAEGYIKAVAQRLKAEGHEVALWHEIDGPVDRERFPTAVFPEQHCLQDDEFRPWIAALDQWRPDVLFGHGLRDHSIEAETLKIGPGIFFAHNYHGTCVSGHKCQTFPRIDACTRTFGPGCLLMFYPRRCGGINPFTLVKDYRMTAARLRVIRSYQRVVTHTAHMQSEYAKHLVVCQALSPYSCANYQQTRRSPTVQRKLLFVGRMVPLKGGDVLLESLPIVTRRLGGPVSLLFVGDGPSRQDWEGKAKRIEREHPGIRIEFAGWLSGESYQGAVSEAELLVVPSLWPEPFGMTGLDLGSAGIPAVAFNVGGIPDWLCANVNGVLAEYSHPFEQSLAEAVIQALHDENEYLELRTGAQRMASTWTFDQHFNRLVRILGEMVATGNAERGTKSANCLDRDDISNGSGPAYRIGRAVERSG